MCTSPKMRTRSWLRDMRMAQEGPVASGDLALAAQLVPQRGQFRLAGRRPDPPDAAAERLVQALGDQPPHDAGLRRPAHQQAVQMIVLCPGSSSTRARRTTCRAVDGVRQVPTIEQW